MKNDSKREKTIPRSREMLRQSTIRDRKATSKDKARLPSTINKYISINKCTRYRKSQEGRKFQAKSSHKRESYDSK
jgi:hypothetical protein